MDTALLDPEMMSFVDNIEDAMIASGAPVLELESIHRFVPPFKEHSGVYCRETIIPAGTMLTTRIHMSEHFFVILEGEGLVWKNGICETYGPAIPAHIIGLLPAEVRDTWVNPDISSGQVNITKPGTRRIIFAKTHTRWATFHAHSSTDPEEIVEDVTYDHDNLCLKGSEPTYIP